MADEMTIAASAEAQAPETQDSPAAPAPKAKPAKAAKAVVEDTAPEPQRQRDPMMDQLVAAQRELEAARKELEGHKARAKQYERDSKKQALLGSLYDEFPGLPRNEIRGAALVAAEDGIVDLYSEDQAAQLDKLKEALRGKSKAKPSPSSSTPAASLGGTPGTASKPPTPARKFLI